MYKFEVQGVQIKAQTHPSEDGDDTGCDATYNTKKHCRADVNEAGDNQEFEHYDNAPVRLDSQMNYYYETLVVF